MPQFITRIQLEGEPGRGDYERLHAAMRRQGFVQTIVGKDGQHYQLPHAEYDCDLALRVDQVRDLARDTAQSVWPEVLVLVTQAQSRSWYLRKT